MTLEEYCAAHPRRTQTAILLCRYLELGPSNTPGLARRMRMNTCHVRRALGKMHAAGLVYIRQWERAGKRESSPWRPIWAIGIGIDMPIPKQDRAQQHRDYQRRRRQRLRNAKTISRAAGLSLAADLVRLAGG